MDKNTLSNYGWIVIAVLILAVMIALATPFGTYIEQGVWNATEGFFNVNDKALDTVGTPPPSTKIQKTMQVNAVHDLGVTYTKGEYREYRYGNIVTTTQNIAGSDFVPITHYQEGLPYLYAGQICVWDADKNFLRGHWDPAQITLDPAAGDVCLYLWIGGGGSGGFG